MDIVILATLAFFLLLKLRSILGKESGIKKPFGKTKNIRDITSDANIAEDKPTGISGFLAAPVIEKSVKKQKKSKKILAVAPEIELPDINLIPKNCHKFYEDILQKFPALTASEMQSGIIDAFENIMDAISSSDMAKMRVVMNSALGNRISTVVKNRNEKIFVQSVKSFQIQSLIMNKKAIVLVAKISSLQIRFTEQNGEIKSGSKKNPIEITDTMFFSRNLKDQSPWVLDDIK